MRDIGINEMRLNLPSILSSVKMGETVCIRNRKGEEIAMLVPPEVKKNNSGKIKALQKMSNIIKKADVTKDELMKMKDEGKK